MPDQVDRAAELGERIEAAIERDPALAAAVAPCRLPGGGWGVVLDDGVRERLREALGAL